MYKIYTTPAFILKTRNSREDSKTITFFTRDLGLLSAHAQGIRKLGAKLNYCLQDFSLVEVSLVRGREFWRVTSVQEKNSLLKTKSNKVKRSMVARIYSLVSRLINGEEKDKDLFSDLEKSFNFLENEDLSNKEIDHLEIILVLKILYRLGYLENTGAFKQFIENPDWNKELLTKISPHRTEALVSINSSFEESQL